MYKEKGSVKIYMKEFSITVTREIKKRETTLFSNSIEFV